MARVVTIIHTRYGGRADTCDRAADRVILAFSTPTAVPALRYCLLHQEILQHQRVHFALHEGVECVRRGIHNRLAPQIKRGVEHNRDTAGLPEPFDQAVRSEEHTSEPRSSRMP